MQKACTFSTTESSSPSWQRPPGQHRLAGGSHWSDIWHYQQRVTVLELSPVDQPDLPAFEDALIQAQAAAKNTFNDNHWEAEKFGKLPFEKRMKPENGTAADAVDGDR